MEAADAGAKTYWEDDIAELAGGDDSEESGAEETGPVEEPVKKEEGAVLEEEEEEDDIEKKALGVAPTEEQSSGSVLRSDRLLALLQVVNEKVRTGRPANMTPADIEEEYQLIVRSNKMLIEIDDDLNEIHKRAKEIYGKKFHELESIVIAPVEYVRVVKAIGNATDIGQVNLQGLVPGQTLISIMMAAATNIGKVLPTDVFAELLRLCEDVLALDDARVQVLAFVESRMQFIAPNLSALVGPNIAAKLMAAAGGLDKLSRIPACNLQILGAKKRHSAGFSTAATLPHTGYVFSSAVVQQAPSDLRMKASRVLAGRVALCSRLDYFHDQPEGGQGLEYKEEILKKIEKWQEPPPPKQIKPLAPPIAVPKKKRGGKRARKMKEKTAMTDVRKFQNRIKFGQAEDEYSNTGKGFGMLGQEGSAVRITTSAKQQLKVSKKFMKGNKGLANPGRATSGLATSLAFTPVQGIELENPNARAEKVRKANERYFSLDAPLVSDRLKRSRSDEPTSTSTATATKQEP
eukprot:GAFH01001457.1.p1 GENE.GAFH01001457.1~~GAFH01001457.1.p1  ORF type:complete len:519 (+),score=182.39 GAFH01001457.1:54-1610(+)